MSARASFADLFEAVPDALLLVDGDGCIVQANAQAERLFGYAPGALLRMPVEALIPAAARERHRRYREHYMAKPHVRPMGVTGQSLIGLRPDGTQFPVEIALSPMAGEHGPRYLASVRDISETQRARQALVRARYDALAARIGQLALEAQDESGVVDALPQLLAAALDIATVAVLFVSGDRQSVEVRASVGLDEGDAAAPGLDEALLLAQLGAGDSVLAEDFASAAAPRFALPAAAGSGVLVPLLDRGRPMGALLALAPQPRHFDHDALHLLRSVANLAAAFVQRRRTEEQLAHSQRLDAIGQLTGGIAHDFNNLLTVMSGSLQLLEMECADKPEAGELIASALRSVGRGAELTGKLLAFARRQRLSPRAVDVPALLGDVESMLKRTLGDSVHLHVQCADALAPAYADPGQLEAALLNLALNARDAMPRGGEIAIEAGAHRVAAAHRGGDGEAELIAGDYLRLTVADTGRGMAPETLARAMEPFFTTKEAGRGSGLGLSMVYGFAKQSGGHLRIDSALGYGTRVELFLPAARAPAAAPAPAAAAHATGRGETVLVVEDDAAVRAIAVAFLRSSGYGVVAVGSAAEALRYLAGDGEAAAMFSDVMLGEGMNGKELAAAARRLRAALPVVLTSGYETPAVAAGEAFDLLRKPYRREQLAAAIARAVGAG